MTKVQAIEELLFQSSKHPDIENPRWQHGFLGMLRPFKGTLLEENFHKTMEAIKTLADEFVKDSISNQIISSIWSICHLTRAWAIEPEGMLRSNQLINTQQIQQLENWLDHISYVTDCLLDNCAIEVAFEMYIYEYPNKL